MQLDSFVHTFSPIRFHSVIPSCKLWKFYADSYQCFLPPYDSAQGQLQHSSCQPTLAIQHNCKKIAFQVSYLNDAPYTAAVFWILCEGCYERGRSLDHTDGTSHPDATDSWQQSSPSSASTEKSFFSQPSTVYDSLAIHLCALPWLHS